MTQKWTAVDPRAVTKYDRLAARWTTESYVDPDYYLSRRAAAFLTLGPPLARGDRVLELGCADGSFADPLLAVGLDYIGVDASGRMVEAAARRLQGRAAVQRGDLNDYRPSEHVAATCAFRCISYVDDRSAFFRAAAEYTSKKLVFDVSPRQHSVDQLRAELEAAGFDGFEMRPFLVPSRRAVPLLARRVLAAGERIGPLSRLLLAFRFSYVCAAFRVGSSA
jgi:predicted TPR repeat methyltransferase